MRIARYAVNGDVSFGIIEGPGTARHLAPEIAHSVQLVAAGTYLSAVEAVTGPLS